MKILDDLLATRKIFEDRDSKEAMSSLMKCIYCEVAPRVTSGNTFILFHEEKEMSTFCWKHRLNIRGLMALLATMREDGLIGQEMFPVKLTQLGVEKLCV